MNPEELFQTFMSLAQAETEEERFDIVNANPVILSEEAIQQVQEWQDIAQQKGSAQDSEFWEQILNFLAFVAHEKWKEDLFQLVTVFMEAKDDEELSRIINEHPEVLSRNSIAQVQEWKIEAEQRKDEYDANFWKEAHNILLYFWNQQLNQSIIALTAASTDEECSQIINSNQDVLSEEAINRVAEWQKQAQEMGDEAGSYFWESIGETLAEYSARWQSHAVQEEWKTHLSQTIINLMRSQDDEEKAFIINSNPDILSDASIQQIQEWQQEAQENGCDEDIRFWQLVSEKIIELQFQKMIYESKEKWRNELLQTLLTLAQTESNEDFSHIIVNNPNILSKDALEQVRLWQIEANEIGNEDASWFWQDTEKTLLHCRAQNQRIYAKIIMNQTSLEDFWRIKYSTPDLFSEFSIQQLEDIQQEALESGDTEEFDAVGCSIERVSQYLEIDVASAHSETSRVMVEDGRLEAAEFSIRAALEIQNRLAEINPEFRIDAAISQSNLGRILGDLGRLEEAENATRAAIAIFEFLQEEQPELEKDTALMQNNLGLILLQLQRFEEAENILRASLDTRMRLVEEDPELAGDMAITQSNVGLILRASGRLEEAESMFRAALGTFQGLVLKSPGVYEYETAMGYTNLGLTLAGLQLMEEAEANFYAAIEIYQTFNISKGKAETLTILGQLLVLHKRWEEAAKFLREAVNLSEQTRSKFLSIVRQREVMTSHFDAYENLFISLVELGKIDEALVVAEQVKSRTLIDLMASKDLEPRNTPSAIVTEYRNVLRQVRALQHNSPFTSADAGKNQRLALEGAYQRYEILAEQIRATDPGFLPHAQPLSHQQMLNLASDAETTLVIFRVTSWGAFIFLVFPNGDTDLIKIPEFNTSCLGRMVMNIDNEQNPSGWFFDYLKCRTSDDEEVFRVWKNNMDSTLETLHTLLMGPIKERLRGSTSLIFVPTRALAILPLHACWWNEEHDGKTQKRYWLDEFKIRYVPNLFIFRRCLEQEEKRRAEREQYTKDTLLGIINPESNIPQQDLPSSMWEGEAIQRLLGKEQCTMLYEQNATRTAFDQSLKSQDFVHFSCHNHYDGSNPLSSTLRLADNTTLSLGEIFEKLDLPNTWLVVLSACETALADVDALTDEHYGLATGFLYAGVPTVFASLWPVDDGSTAMLMAHAYELLKTSRDKAQALCKSQQWLRNLTRDEALAVLPQSKHADKMRQWLNQFSPRARPFEHPYYWAAFQCVGV